MSLIRHNFHILFLNIRIEFIYSEISSMEYKNRSISVHDTFVTKYVSLNQISFRNFKETKKHAMYVWF